MVHVVNIERCVLVCVTEMVGSYWGSLSIQHSLLLTGSGQWGGWGWADIIEQVDRDFAGDEGAIYHLFGEIKWFIESF